MPTILTTGAALLATGCSAAPAAAPARSPAPVETPLLCDPGAGAPRDTVGCPDPEPETGWLTATPDGLALTPFRTLGNDAEGGAWAREHGEDFPFPNDHLDVPAGADRPLELARRTTCTGIVRVGYREPLDDRVVPCDDLVTAAGQARVPVAVWSSDGEVIQASELYRP